MAEEIHLGWDGNIVRLVREAAGWAHIEGVDKSSGDLCVSREWGEHLTESGCGLCSLGLTLQPNFRTIGGLEGKSVQLKISPLVRWAAVHHSGGIKVESGCWHLPF